MVNHLSVSIITGVVLSAQRSFALTRPISLPLTASGRISKNFFPHATSDSSQQALDYENALRFSTTLYQISKSKELTASSSSSQTKSNQDKNEASRWSSFRFFLSNNDGTAQMVSDRFSSVRLAAAALVMHVLDKGSTFYQTIVAPSRLLEPSSTVPNSTTTATSVLQTWVKEYFWLIPLSLCLVPPISYWIFQTAATTPPFWKMTDMRYILESSDAAFVISCFLGSNIAYFLAGLYLLKRFPARSLKPGLGYWIIAAGLVSTIFHSYQAAASNVIAEALCFVDHGVAGSASLYYWKTCGTPESKRVWFLGIAGLIALSLPLRPGYAWLHSLWHFLSAGAAICWALTGKLQRPQRLLQAIQRQRQASKHF